jgi:hypothetical protein
MMTKPSNSINSTLRKVFLIPFLTIPAFLFSAETGAQNSLQTSDAYNDDLRSSLTHLNVIAHPEDENVAIIKLFLKEDSPVLFQLSINEGTLSIVDKNLPAGDHSIHFDYSNLKNADDVDFSYFFEIGDETDIELNGPFIQNGKLQVHHKDMYKP